MTRDELLSKIRKLLSLSKSANEHEAALAAEKAKKLLDEHNIKEFELTKTIESIIEKEAYAFGKKTVTWIRIIASGLSKYLDCKTVLIGNKLKVIGSKTDIEVFEYLFSYLINTVERLTQKETKTIPYMTNARSYKDSFRKGMAMGIYTKLMLIKQGEKQAPTTNCTALVLTKEKEVNAFFTKLYPYAITQKMRTIPQSYGYMKGLEAGRNVEINKGVKSSLNTISIS